MNIYRKYAHLLVNYCLALKEGERAYVASTYLAEPLLQEFYKEALEAGAQVEFDIAFKEQQKIFFDHATDFQLKDTSPFKKLATETFDAYLVIRAPFNVKELQQVPPEKKKITQQAGSEVKDIWDKRTASGEMKRSVCQFPTPSCAQEAGMSVKEYEQFVFNACFLNEDVPMQKWLEVRANQQKIVDVLNMSKHIHFKGKNCDISFSVAGRKWINSDGRTNMPSGEVFTSPVESSVNGKIHFTYPGLIMGAEIEGITLEVKDGEVVKWSADTNQDVLDHVLSMPGARRFGEAAIGTNEGIQRFTKNILFDEKMGGTIHMALGQSYLHTGGKNNSVIHWDLITDMREDGEIHADGELIYKKGKFLLPLL